MAVKSISVPDDVKTFLDGLPNASKYVVDLIQKDREGGGESLENQIRKVLTDLLSNNPTIPVIVTDGGQPSFKNEILELLEM
jgi:hypothetical protein